MHDITIDTNFRSGGPPPPQPEKLEPLGPPPPQPELKLEPLGPPPQPELSFELLEPPPSDTLVTHSNPLAGDHHEQALHEAFSRFDASGDEFISKAELSSLLVFMGMESDEVRTLRSLHTITLAVTEVGAPVGQSYLSGVWSAFDTDQNGLLDYEVRGRLAQLASILPWTIIPCAIRNFQASSAVARASVV
jgi:hypothetical protein